MVTVSAAQGLGDGGVAGWARVERLVLADGSAAHPHLRRLLASPAGATAVARDLGDALHGLCAVYGRQPGMADDALCHAAQPAIGGWLGAVADGFAAERGYLARLVAAAGPVPSTPGQLNTEAAFAAQRHALAMLARSDRRGCAGGAVAALVVDWRAIRPVLDLAAERFGVAVAPDRLPPTALAIAALADQEPACERATGFGAQQLVAQVQGFWNLLEARSEARG